MNEEEEEEVELNTLSKAEKAQKNFLQNLSFLDLQRLTYNLILIHHLFTQYTQNYFLRKKNI